MSFEKTAGTELKWEQPEILRRFYRLTQDGREVATLRFENRWGSLATGACGPAQWTFKRAGFLSPRVSVRQAGSEAEMALFTPGWMGGGWVAFGSGRRFHLRHTNFWGTEWAFETEDGTAVATLSGSPGFFQHGGTATLAPSAAQLPEAPVLLVLIWYVRLLMNEDAAAGGAVVAASG